MIDLEDRLKGMEMRYDTDLNVMESAEYVHYALKNKTPVKLKHVGKLWPDLDLESFLNPVEVSAGFEHITTEFPGSKVDSKATNAN
jgi:hypothetical protein